MAAKFWTKKRLESMRRTYLPSAYTIAEAASKAQKRWKRNFSRRRFELCFVNEYGKGPGEFLKQQEFDNPADIDAPAQPPAESPVFLRRRIKQLEKELKTSTQQNRISALVKSYLRGAEDYKDEAPTWTVDPGKRSFNGTPTLFVSDIHHGETVFPKQVNGANQFNPQISRKRMEQVFKRTIHVLDDVFSNANYPGIVMPFGGDMVTGNIHEELRETNSMPIFDAMLDLSDILTSGIRLMKERYKRVFIPCVVGNHGRLDKKPRMKFGPHDNFEYMLYHLIASRFEKDPDVTFEISDSFFMQYKVHSTVYMLTHGDCFKGGGGISGPLTPWALGDARLRKQLGAVETWTRKQATYDVLIFGHWHQYFPARNFVVNGSVKGFDEYAKKKGFSFEPPTQALWLTSPKYGMTFNAPIYAEDPPRAKKESQWVSLPSE